jgi:hypothetical protein
MSELRFAFDALIAAERRNRANPLLRDASSAALEGTRILVLDQVVEVDEAVAGGLA